MTDQEYNNLLALAQETLAKSKAGLISREESLLSLRRAGILDENGIYTENYPTLREYQLEHMRLQKQV